MTMSPIELLAPAGSLDILKSAVDAGADAVYAGVGVFNARMNASNLTEDELRDGCLYAHRRGSKVYLTLNTLINSSEMDEAVNIASYSYDAGVDGILVQDIGLAVKLHELYPSIPLHASTQMNVFSEDQFAELASIGSRRVVLPRELSLDEIKRRCKIASEYGIETEVFVHGAVCVCYSGLCLYSSMNKSGTRSGNRGMCAQPCRQQYSLSFDGIDLKKGHLISPKDRSALRYISSLIEAGVSSLKIEGRMRDRSYVTTVVDSYRRIIDASNDGSVSRGEIRKIENDLLINFNRGGSFTSQYLTGHKPDDMLSGEYVGKYGLRLGKITRTDKKQGIIEFTFNSEYPVPSKGDYLSIRENDNELFSFPVGKIHEAPGKLVIKGLHPDSIAAIKGSPDVYLMNHDTVKLGKNNIRKTPVKIVLTVSDNAVEAEAIVTEGINKDVTGNYEILLDSGFDGKAVPRDRIIEQLSKTGDTPYRVTEVVFDKYEDVHCPISLINELRRGLTDDLTSSIDYEREHTCIREFVAPKRKEEPSNAGTIKTLYYFPSVRAVKGDLRRDSDIYAFSLYDLVIKDNRERIYGFMENNKTSIILVLPDAYHDKLNDVVNRADRELKENFKDRYLGIMDSRVTGLGNCRSGHFLSAGANLFNADSIGFALSRSQAVTLSYELSPDEAIETLKGLYAGKDDTVIIHSGGPIAWMQSDFCPLGAHRKGCKECYDRPYTTLSDSDGHNECKVISHSADCSCSIYGNAKYTYSDKNAEEIADQGFNVIQMFTEI